MTGTTRAGAPTSPVVSAVADSTAALSVAFTAPAGNATITGYDYSLNSGQTWTAATLVGGAISIPSLNSNTLYPEIRIRARNAGGNGVATADLVGTTRAEAPTVGVGSGASPTSISVPFTLRGDAAANIQYSLNGGAWVDRTNGSGTTSPIVISQDAAGDPLAGDTTYAVRLRAVNAGGAGDISTSVNVATLVPAPTSPLASGVVGDGSRLSVAFAQEIGVTSSTISGYEFSVASGPWTTALGTSSPIVLPGLSPNTAYPDIRIRAINDGGPSAASASFSGTTTPGAPTSLTLAGRTQTELTVTFTAPPSAPAPGAAQAITTYEYSTNGGADWRVRTDGGGASATLTITETSNGATDLAAGTLYAVKVRAVSDAGAGTPSSELSVATLANGPVITAIDAAKVGSAYVLDVSFQQEAGGPYAYEYSTDDGATWRSGTEVLPPENSTTSSLTITETSAATPAPLVANTPYTVRLRSNKPGTGPGAPFVGLTLPAPPSTPLSLAAVNGVGTQLTASFGLEQGPAAYSVEFSTNAGDDWAPATGTGPATITGLQPNTSYSVLLRTKNASGVSDATAVGTAVTVVGEPVIGDTATGTTTTSMRVAFTLPSDPANRISYYEYSTDGGSTWARRTDDPDSLASPLTIDETSSGSPLQWGAVYDVRLRAVSAAGTGVVAAKVTSTQSLGPINLEVGNRLANEVTVRGVQPGWPGVSPVAGGPQYTSNGGASEAEWVWLDPLYSPGLGFIAISEQSLGVPLASNTSYVVRLRYKQVGGVRGVASDPVNATTSPVAPADITLVSQPTASPSAAVALTQSDIGPGRAAITGYEYSLTGEPGSFIYDATAVDATSTAVTATIGQGLAPNTAYTVWLRPTNTGGDGAYAASATVTTRPAPPAGIAVTDNTVSSAVVSFDSPTGDIPLTYQYSTNGGSTWEDISEVSIQSERTSFTLTGLAAGTASDVQVRASNVAGPGFAAATQVVTRTGAPGSVSASPRSGSALVTWTNPGPASGPAAVTNYVVEFRPSGGEWTPFSRGFASAATSTLVTGLANGTSYEFRVRATNAAGDSVFSDPSSGVTPAAVFAPATPVITSVTPGSGSATVTWGAFDANDTGGGFVSFRAVAVGTQAACVVAFPANSCTVTGLTNGTGYTFTVTASNQAGARTSTSSATVTPTGVPGAPAVTTLTPADTQVTVAWSAPSSTGGSAITGYTVTASPGGAQCTTGGATSCAVTGLSNGVSYRFTVTAANGVGTGPASAPSQGSVPRTVPAAPSSVTAAAGNALAVVSWQPADNGGAAITGYTVTGNPSGGCSVAASARSCTITGLSNGTGYTFTVVASNVAGPSTASAPTASVTPQATVPGPVRSVVAVPGIAEVSLTWLPPLSDGGAAIVDYLVQYSTDGGVSWTPVERDASTALSATVTGLQNGVAYLFRVAADNDPGVAAGQGLWSAPSASVTPNAPTRPAGLVALPQAVGVERSVAMTVSGTDIAAGATVASAGGVAVSVSLVSAPGGSVSFTLTGGDTAGTATLSVTNPDGGVGFLTVTVTPSLGSLSITSTPAAVAAGATRTIAVAGTGIQAGAEVTFPAESGLSVVGSPTATTNGSLAVTVSATAGATTSDLTVTNPDGGSAAVSLAVNAPPTVGAVAPDELSPGAVNVPMVVTGTGFAMGAILTTSPVGSETGQVTVTAAQYVSPTQLNITVSASSDASAGDWFLTITNRDGGQGVTSISIAEQLGATGVVITGRAGTDVAQGETVSVTVNGSGFMPGSTVLMSGSGLRVRSVRVVNSSTITFSLTVAASAPEGARSLTVVSPDGTRAVLPEAVTVVVPAPPD